MYLVLIEGSGEGCDYTVGCNKTWKFYDADKTEREMFEDLYVCYNGSELSPKFRVIEIADAKITDYDSEKLFDKMIEAKEKEQERNEEKEFFEREHDKSERSECLEHETG